jgi:hypothetical protein
LLSSSTGETGCASEPRPGGGSIDTAHLDRVVQHDGHKILLRVKKSWYRLRRP